MFRAQHPDSRNINDVFNVNLKKQALSPILRHEARLVIPDYKGCPVWPLTEIQQWAL